MVASGSCATILAEICFGGEKIGKDLYFLRDGGNKGLAIAEACQWNRACASMSIPLTDTHPLATPLYGIYVSM